MALKKKSPGRASSKKGNRKPRLAIIGAGRMGTTLGRALKGLGYKVDIVVSEHAASARRAARSIGAGTRWLTSAQFNQPGWAECELFSETEVFLIATPDDAISSVAAQLARLIQLSRVLLSRAATRSSHRVALHVSGAFSSLDLRPLPFLGIAVGSMHPLVSISDSRSSPRVFREAFFCIEGDAASVRVARSMVRELGGNGFTINTNAKALYHAAAVTASGHVVALFDIATEMLSQCGLSRRRAQKALLPLMLSTLQNLSQKDPSRALTGPFSRGDVTTVRKHVEAIHLQRLAQALEAYLLLGKRSLSLAKSRKEAPDALDRIAQVLAEAPSVEP